MVCRWPQARGRGERLNRTLQDRLVNELRRAGITSVAAANTYLRERFIPDYNATFTRGPPIPVEDTVPKFRSPQWLTQAAGLGPTSLSPGAGRHSTGTVGHHHHRAR